MKLVLVREKMIFRFFGLFFLLSLLIGTPGSKTVSAQGGNTCFVSVNNSGVTDHASADASALRDAVNAATAGSTLKMAGTCAGTASNRVVNINKNLTIVGGYDPSDWSTTPDNVADPTVLDAQQGGRAAIITNNATVTLRHLTLRNGFFSDDTQFGGAILVNAGSELLVAQSRIEESEAYMAAPSTTSGRCRSSRARSATTVPWPAAPSTFRASAPLPRP